MNNHLKSILQHPDKIECLRIQRFHHVHSARPLRRCLPDIFRNIGVFQCIQTTKIYVFVSMNLLGIFSFLLTTSTAFSKVTSWASTGTDSSTNAKGHGHAN